MKSLAGSNSRYESLRPSRIEPSVSREKNGNCETCSHIASEIPNQLDSIGADSESRRPIRAVTVRLAARRAAVMACEQLMNEDGPEFSG